MPVQKLKNYLDVNNVHYVSIIHSKAHTSQEIAASSFVSGYEFAKTIMIMVDNKLTMCVLPATNRISFEQIKVVINAKEVRMATAAEFIKFFPNCELGAMPPFGNLWNMDTYIDASLSEHREISFNAGNLHEVIKMRYRDYDILVKPMVMYFSYVTA